MTAAALARPAPTAAQVDLRALTQLRREWLTRLDARRQDLASRDLERQQRALAQLCALDDEVAIVDFALGGTASLAGLREQIRSLKTAAASALVAAAALLSVPTRHRPC